MVSSSSSGSINEEGGTNVLPLENSKELCSSSLASDVLECTPVDPSITITDDDVSGTLDACKPMEEEKNLDALVAVSVVTPLSTDVFDTTIPWCKLMSQYSQNPHVPICHPVFNIGSSKQCNFSFKDKSTSSILCKINRTQRDGSVIAVLETTGAKGSVQVNGKFIKKKTSYALNSGDEVIFNSPGHAYIFQQLTTETAAEVPSSVGVSVVAGASLSSLRQDLSFLTPPAQTTREAQEASEISSPPLARDSPNMNVDDQDVREKFDSSTGSDKASEVGETSKNIPFDNSQDSGLGSDNVLDERKELEKDAHPALTSLVSLKCAALKEDIRREILDQKDIEVSFDNFPYYLSESTKNVLIDAAFIHLKHRKYTKYTTELPIGSPRILLCGPTGSDIYQEMLSKALANHFGARLLIFDSNTFLGGLSLKEMELLKDGLLAEKSSAGISDLVKSTNPSSAQADAPIPAKYHLKLEANPAPSSTVASKNHLFKTDS